ncbi:hypothetical protein AB4Y44_10480 [Paraburkholderia sp. BR10937]|uniref:hypothetical protein n=1 Tax=Paraburkholderia sp. BR10937 TaxID=3236994 RepID=UPI0034D25040
MELLCTDGLDILLENSRDYRTLDYLVSTCGLSRVQRARASLPGRTRPYVSNIAKALGVKIPDAVVITPREDGRRELAAIKQLLAEKLVVGSSAKRL